MEEGEGGEGGEGGEEGEGVDKRNVTSVSRGFAKGEGGGGGGFIWFAAAAN